MLDNDTRDIETCCKIQQMDPCPNQTGAHQSLVVFPFISNALQCKRKRGTKYVKRMYILTSESIDTYHSWAIY